MAEKTVLVGLPDGSLVNPESLLLLKPCDAQPGYPEINVRPLPACVLVIVGPGGDRRSGSMYLGSTTEHRWTIPCGSLEEAKTMVREIGQRLSEAYRR